MAGFDLQVELKNKKYFTETQKSINKILSNLDDFTPVWKEFIPAYLKEVKNNYDSKGSVFGYRWKGLTAKYRKRKAKMSPTAGVSANLRLTDKLYRAATRKGTGYFEELGRKELKMGINKGAIPYVNVHQFGHKKIPKRPYFFKEDGSITIRMQKGLVNAALRHVYGLEITGETSK